jgi:NitT/TauT family transport system substrate-binding protein
MQIIQSRRDFLASVSAAGAAGVLGARVPLADEGPPEVTTIRLPYNNNVCIAPTNIADDLLRAEGFTDVQYRPIASGPTSVQMAGRGEVDIGVTFAGTIVFELDHGNPVTALAGVHSAVTSCSRTSPFEPSPT